MDKVVQHIHKYLFDEYENKKRIDKLINAAESILQFYLLLHPEVLEDDESPRFSEKSFSEFANFETYRPFERDCPLESRETASEIVHIGGVLYHEGFPLSKDLEVLEKIKTGPKMIRLRIINEKEFRELISKGIMPDSKIHFPADCLSTKIDSKSVLQKDHSQYYTLNI